MEFKVRNRPNIPRNRYGYVTSVSMNTTNTTSSEGSTIVSGGSGGSSDVASRLAETHTFWGNPFNGTQNVEGDLTMTEGKNLTVGGASTFKGNTTFDGTINTITNDLTVGGQSNLNNTSVGGNLNVEGNTTLAQTTIGGNLTANSTTTLNGTVTINDNTKAEDILPKADKTYNLGNAVYQWLNLFADNGYLKNLTVTGSAHFFELIIDKIKSVGGAVLLTPADGFSIDKIVQSGNAYTLYWQCQDADGNQRDNMWKVGDQAICKSFNQAKVGTTHNVSNKSWWAKVTATNDASNPTIIDDIAYNYITVTTADCDGTLNPEVGDEVAMLGNRTDTARQSAIYISAGTSIDTGIQAPLIACYQGVNDYDLASHRKSYFDRTGAKFVGDFEIGGQTAEDYIQQKVDEKQIHTPFIDPDGYWYVWNEARQEWERTVKAEGEDGHSPYINTDTNNWMVWDSTQNKYVDSGISAIGKDAYAPYIGDDGYWYEWDSTKKEYVKTSKAQGEDADFYTITPITEIVYVNETEQLMVNAEYKIQHIVGATITDVTPSYSGYHLRLRTNAITDWIYTDIEQNTCVYNQMYLNKYWTNRKGQDQVMYFALFNGDTFITQRAVPVTTSGAAFFSVKQATDNSIASITSRVTAAEANISNNYTELTNRCSTIEQTAEGIQTQVSQNTTKISDNYTELTNRCSTIEQNATKITSRVGSLEVNTENNMLRLDDAEQAISDNTADITTTNNRVSTIEQTASSIQSTVSSMTKYAEGCNLLTGSNLDGKDTKLYYTCDKYSHLCMLPINGWLHNAFYCDVETTTKAAFYGLHWGGYGRENVILEVGKEYTASVWVYGHGKISMEIQYYDTISGASRNGHYNSHVFIVEEAQGWQQISFDFTVNKYTTSDKSTVHYAEVYYTLYNTEDGKNKVRGGQVYFSCPMLAPKGVKNWQFAKNETRRKSENILDGTLEFKQDGNLTIVNADAISEYDNDIVASSKYISATSFTSADWNLLQWEINSDDLNENTDYVLSFDARSTSTEGNTLLNLYLYYSGGGPVDLMENSQGKTAVNGSDGYTQITLDNIWTRYWVHWHLTDGWKSSNNIVNLLFRIPSGGNNAQIALPKFEYGAVVTDYDEGGDMMSRITQTSSNINASIVDLTTGLEAVGLNLNGVNSTITMKGNVEIRPPETAKGGEAEYLKVYDTAGIERVIVESENIPTILELSNKLSGTQYYTLAAPTYKTFTYSSNLGCHVWSNSGQTTMNIGYIPTGTTMTLNTALTSYFTSFSGINVSLSNHQYNLVILKDGTSVFSKALTHSVNSTKTNTISYAMTGGNYSIRITEAGTIKVYGLATTETVTGVLGWSVKMSLAVDKPSFTQIGQNGMVIAGGFNKYLYYDGSQFAVRNGKDGIVLDDNGLHRLCVQSADTPNNALMTCGFSKKEVYTTTSTTLTLPGSNNIYNKYDLFLFKGTSATTLRLDVDNTPTNNYPWPCEGHTIQVKKINNGGLTVKTYKNGTLTPLILSLDGSDVTNSYSCGNTCTTLTWTGEYWVTSK